MTEINKSIYYAIVVGSGISGLYCALKLAQYNSDKQILLVTKSELKDSNSYYAQGGMVAVLKNNKSDSVELHLKDTLIAGAGLSEPETVEFISKNSDETVQDLLTFGVEFDRGENGEFTLTKEAAHSVNRILHSGGDATGRMMDISLCQALKDVKNIDIAENITLTAILKNKNDECCGLEVFDNASKETRVIYSHFTILATGGIGQLYKYTTNPHGATGDGLASAYRIGAELRDMEFVQFHPTALAIDDPINHNRFLISEAVRGEGAKLCDKSGNRYMQKYDEREDLAPRDIVARANFTEMQNNNTENVYLDATIIDHDKLLHRFPTIAAKCKEYGIDITKDYIPVAPAAHYFMGGIKVDLNGETSIKNLFAIGEVASTGLHGANRLASNSLLECVVCAYKTAQYITNSTGTTDFTLPEIIKQKNSVNTANIPKLKAKLQTTMWENVGIYRNEKTLTKALDDICEMENSVSATPNSKEEYELNNMITVAKLITKSALNRKESRGAHYRTDFLQKDIKPQHNVVKFEK